MKRFYTITTLFFPALLMLSSCESLPLNYYRSRAWFMPQHQAGEAGVKKQKKRILGTVKLLEVSVDRTGGWDSIEKEISALAPLYFWEQGYAVVAHNETADYAAEIAVREREYSFGWRTRRSLAAEVRLWAYGDDPASGALPLAAGRFVSIGNRSFSSSDTAGIMLSRAIKKALKRLSAAKKRG